MPRMRRDVLSRFYEKVDQDGPLMPGMDTPCWQWTASLNGSYGQFYFFGMMRLAHRVAYVLHVGEIPEGLTIDHLCRNTKCVNPDHLEPVTIRVNLLRGDGFVGRRARQTHCVRGHLLSGPNLYTWRGGRHCRPCRTEATRRKREREAS